MKLKLLVACLGVLIVFGVVDFFFLGFVFGGGGKGRVASTLSVELGKGELRGEKKHVESDKLRNSSFRVSYPKVGWGDKNIFVNLNVGFLSPKPSNLFYRLYISDCEDRGYTLIHSGWIKWKGANSFSGFTLSDSNLFKIGKNNVYYRCDLYDKDKSTLAHTFPVIKCPVIHPPQLNGDCWAWSPADSGGESVSGYWVESINYDSGIFRFVNLANKPIKRKIDIPEANMPLYARFMLFDEPSTVNVDVAPYSFMLPTTSDPKEAMCFSPTFTGSGSSLFYEKLSVYLNFSKKLPDGTIERYAEDCKTQVVAKRFVVNRKKMNTPSSVSELQAGKLSGKNVGLGCYVKTLVKRDGKKKKMSQKVWLNFYVPPAVPKFQLQSTSKGIMLSWGEVGIDLDQFMVPPRMGVFRKEKGSSDDVRLVGDVAISTSRFLDNDIERNVEYEYSLRFINGVLKTQAWVAGLKQENFFVSLSNYSGKYLRKNSSIRSKIDKKYMRNNLPESDKSSSKSQMANITDEDLMIDLKRPLRVAIWREDYCHEKTGVLGVRLLDELLRGLENQKDILVYDRMRINELLEECLISGKSVKMNALAEAGVDYVLRLRDYSREAGNGIELWMTKLRGGREEERSLNIYHSWRIANILVREKDEQKEGMTKTLLGKIRKLSKGKTSRKPENTKKIQNVVLNSISPVEQKSQVKQYNAISETLQIMLSNQLKGIDVYSRDNWGLVLRERMALAAEKGELGKLATPTTDVLLSGRVWKNREGLSYFFLASDLATGQIVGHVIIEGELEKVGEKLAKWINSLRCPTAMTKPASQSEEDTLDQERKIKPFERFYNVDEDRDSSTKVSIKSLLGFVDEKWKNSEKMVAITLLENAWRKSRKPEVGDRLADYYHSLELFSSEANILNELIKESGDKKVVRRLNKARSLAKKRGDSFEPKIFKQKISAPKPVELDKNVLGRISSRSNKQFDAMYYCARRRIGMEWNPSGRVMAKTQYIFETDSLEKIIDSPFGVWREYQCVKWKGKRERYMKATIVNWCAFPFLNKKQEAELFAFEGYLNPRTTTRSIRLLFDCVKMPDAKLVSKDRRVMTAKDYLKSKLDVFRVGNQERVNADNYLAAYLLASHGDSKARKIVEKIKKTPIPKDIRKDMPDGQDSRTFIGFKAFLGVDDAVDYLQKNYDRNFFNTYNKDEMMFLLMRAGDKKIVIRMIKNDEVNNAIPELRWANSRIVEKIISSKNPLFSREPNFYFCVGFQCQQAKAQLLKSYSNTTDIDALEALVLIYGKPITEICPDLEP